MVPEAKLERLRESLVNAGLKVPASGYAETVLRELESELAPLRLPAELRALYRRVAVGSVPFGPDGEVAAPFTPWFADVALSWWLWRASRDRPGLMPEALFPVVWCGAVTQLVELSDGGRVYEWRRATGELEACHASVAEWLDALARLVADRSARLFTLREDVHWLEVSTERERELRSASDTVRAGDPANWPERWRTASAAFDDRRPRRHRELSISELLWERPAAATVSGLVWSGAARRGPARLRLLDGTGWLEVCCPAGLPGLWTVEHETAVELDVTFAGEQATATALRLRTFG